MKKDIEIPEVKQVSMAVVQEYAPSFKHKDWNVYLINEGQLSLDMVLVVSKGADAEKDLKTSVIRRKINSLPPQSFAKIEFIPDELRVLNNLFQVTYFQDGKMFEKNFSFAKNTISEENYVAIPLINKQGVLAQ